MGHTSRCCFEGGIRACPPTSFPENFRTRAFLDFIMPDIYK